MDELSLNVGNTRPAAFIQRHFLWLLIGCYSLAMVWPNAGLTMHNWRWDAPFTAEGQVTFQLLLLAWMLFCGAVATDVGQIRSMLHQPFVLVAALAAVWIGPALLVALAGWVVPRLTSDPSATGVLVGLALVATMPVANSSVGWVQNARGNLALGLALVVLSISLSPWITPRLLAVFSKTLSPEVREQREQLVTNYSGWFFVIWVILPTALGLMTRRCAAQAWLQRASGWLSISSAAALLALNYISASQALPKASQSSPGLLLLTAALALALSGVGLALGWGLAQVMRLGTATRTGLVFGLSMKNTGLALVLSESVPVEKKMVVLLIVLATLGQHVVAGVVQWWSLRAETEGSATKN